MSVRHGVVVLLALCLWESSVQGRDVLQQTWDDHLHHGASDSGCTEPPEGEWIVSHNFPSAPGNNTLAFQIRCIMILTKVLDNVYQGSAAGIVVNPELPTLTVGQPAAYGLNGIWDEDTCTMSAVMYNFEAGIADPMMLRYDEETLSGPYLNTDNGAVLFSRTGRFDLSPLSSA